MTGRNFATAEEARGGINVDINQKTQRRVGVRKRTRAETSYDTDHRGQAHTAPEWA